MSDAPERVWVKEGYDSWGQYGHWYANGKGGGTEYVKADRIEELEAKLAREKLTIEALQGLRPVWAQGWTDDSMAAQASGNALAQLWEMLGVKDQTQAVAILAELKGKSHE